jgi:hypothetical protein
VQVSIEREDENARQSQRRNLSAVPQCGRRYHCSPFPLVCFRTIELYEVSLT